MTSLGRHVLQRRASRGLRATRNAAGFTLLEVLMVLLLIAAATALAAAAVTNGFSGIRLRSDAKEIAAQLRYTRAQAIATGEPQRFLIDPAAHTWTAPNERGGTIDPKFGVAFTGAREVQPTRGIGAIVFFSDGASTGGRVQLSSREAAWNVDVQWLTGEVKVHRGQVAR
ncbi:MAG: prepilin-type N-terminal cleavage/methylation domain-containing protein [Lysobacter sp.]|nr:prepilin-type N-terminal cleavage/methylation domain-containing protein [Lysobacter sp.]